MKNRTITDTQEYKQGLKSELSLFSVLGDIIPKNATILCITEQSGCRVLRITTNCTTDLILYSLILIHKRKKRYFGKGENRNSESQTKGNFTYELHVLICMDGFILLKAQVSHRQSMNTGLFWKFLVKWELVVIIHEIQAYIFKMYKL